MLTRPDPTKYIRQNRDQTRSSGQATSRFCRILAGLVGSQSPGVNPTREQLGLTLTLGPYRGHQLTERWILYILVVRYIVDSFGRREVARVFGAQGADFRLARPTQKKKIFSRNRLKLFYITVTLYYLLAILAPPPTRRPGRLRHPRPSSCVSGQEFSEFGRVWSTLRRRV